MNIFLILSVLVLIAISIWQITKIFELSQAKKINTQVANDSDNNLNGKLMLAFLFFIYGITIFSFWAYGDVLLPNAASEHGNDYDNLMVITFYMRSRLWPFKKAENPNPLTTDDKFLVEIGIHGNVKELEKLLKKSGAIGVSVIEKPK